VRNEDYRTPLDPAAGEGNADVVRLLIAEVDSRGEWSPWGLIMHCEGHLEVLRVLVDLGTSSNARNKKRWNSIHLSAGQTPYQVVGIWIRSNRGFTLKAWRIPDYNPFAMSDLHFDRSPYCTSKDSTAPKDPLACNCFFFSLGWDATIIDWFGSGKSEIARNERNLGGATIESLRVCPEAQFLVFPEKGSILRGYPFHSCWQEAVRPVRHKIVTVSRAMCV
jgi:hypothetical protein